MGTPIRIQAPERDVSSSLASDSRAAPFVSIHTARATAMMAIRRSDRVNRFCHSPGIATVYIGKNGHHSIRMTASNLRPSRD